MGLSTKDRLLSLIFPALCVIYGVLEILSGISLYSAAALAAIAAGLIIGAVSLIFKINTTGYLKILTITTVISFMLWMLIGQRIIFPVIDVLYNIIVLAIAVFISTVKMPDEASLRDRLIVFFSNPVFYSLLNWLWKLFIGYLYKVGVIL